MRAFFVPVIAAFSAILLSGCMHTASPVAVGQPHSDLDAMAYGMPSSDPVAATGQGGAIPALRNAFAAAPRGGAYVMPAGYTPPRYDAAYHLDAGDRLRVVVYGQEGLTNTY
ncbi:MAG: polysaccharide export protein, partial [Bradyrhizobium sp.]|nr:polysaccharide export protein [Bradyrhizobium sp.]